MFYFTSSIKSEPGGEKPTEIRPHLTLANDIIRARGREQERRGPHPSLVAA
jgi:hypothetical protein